jgi:hypothetical protein
MGINDGKDSIFLKEIAKNWSTVLHIPYIILFTSPITSVALYKNTLA